jgi:hypothetical protein
MMKFSQAISQVKWLSGEKTNISKTISVLILRVLVVSDDLQNVGFFTAQPFDPADSLRELQEIKLCSIVTSAICCKGRGLCIEIRTALVTLLHCWYH